MLVYHKSWSYVSDWSEEIGPVEESNDEPNERMPKKFGGSARGWSPERDKKKLWKVHTKVPVCFFNEKVVGMTGISRKEVDLSATRMVMLNLMPRPDANSSTFCGVSEVTSGKSALGKSRNSGIYLTYIPFGFSFQVLVRCRRTGWALKITRDPYRYPSVFVFFLHMCIIALITLLRGIA